MAARQDDGLVLYYDFEEESGDIAHDKSKHGNDGKITTADWKHGAFGRAMYFNGKDTMIECPASESLAATAAAGGAIPISATPS